MNYEWLKIAGAVAGIGGVAIACVAYIFREIIRKEIFPQLKPKQAYALLNRIITLIFIVGVLGVVAYIIVSLRNGNNKSNTNEMRPSPTPIASNKIDNTQNFSQNLASINTPNNVPIGSQTQTKPRTNTKRLPRTNIKRTPTPASIIQDTLVKPSNGSTNE